MINSLLKLFSPLSSGVNTFCPLCNQSGVGFNPLPDFFRDNALKYGYTHFGNGEMTALETYSCSNCGASDRERLYAYWIDQQIKARKISKNNHVIHFAPETVLSNKLKSVKFKVYHTADLSMAGCDFMLDMMMMPFEDESYDFFICSHVLEHVESDDKAISELHRITKKNGCGILMAPIIVGLNNTLEDPSVTDEAGRWKNFGQFDHVRLYSHNDYIAKIKSHGFSIKELDVDYFGENVFQQLGLKSSSILYVVTK